MNKAAQALGRLARGVPKSFSAAEIQRRKKRLAEARKKRWAKKNRSKLTAKGRPSRKQV